MQQSQRDIHLSNKFIILERSLDFPLSGFPITLQENRSIHDSLKDQ